MHNDDAIKFHLLEIKLLLEINYHTQQLLLQVFENSKQLYSKILTNLNKAFQQITSSLIYITYSRKMCNYDNEAFLVERAKSRWDS